MVDARQRAALRARLAALVERDAAARRAVIRDPTLAPRLRALESYQSRRLLTTHAGLRSEPRYRAAVDFFLQDLYGPPDLAGRDAQLLRALDRLGRFLPLAALQALAHAFELHVLTLELDAATAARLAVAAPLDDATYARAYRAADRRADRERQIELVGVAGRLLDSIAHRRDVVLLLRVARAPAHAAGYGRLQDFIERGHAAFRKMDGAGAFLDAVVERERALLQRLLA